MSAVFPPLRLIFRVRRDHEEGPVTTGLSLFIYLFFSYPLPNHFLSPSSRRPPPRISPFALLAHTIIYSFIPLCGVVFPFGTLIFLFILDFCRGEQKEESKRSRLHRRRGHAHDVADEQRLCATSLAEEASNVCIFVVCHQSAMVWLPRGLILSANRDSMQM